MSEAHFVLSKKALKKQYEQLENVSDVISYSAKTNYEVASVLEDTSDCFFSIHSFESLEKIKDKTRVWFLAQAWTTEDIEKLTKQGVKKFIVDNVKDLQTLTSCLNTEIDLLLRMRLSENTIHTGKYFVFGMFAKEINEHIPNLRKNKHIKQLGVHFHRKSQNISEWNLQYELSQVLSEETIKAIDLVNMGGGIPIRYKNFRGEVLPKIFESITKFKDWLHTNNTKLIVEPGRFLAGPAVTLHTTIQTIYNHNIIVNCSVYNTAMDTFVSHMRLEVQGELEKGEAYTLKGKTPCSMDIFRYKVHLENPKEGDTLILLNAGAYNFTSDFCALRKLPTTIVD